MVFSLLPRTLAAAAVASLATAPMAEACTGILLTSADGSVIGARTLEFGIDLKSQIKMIPRGYVRTGSTPDGKPGMVTTAKYASVGMNAFGLDVLLDGVNEEGLSVGLFYFPGTAGYMAYEAADADRTVAPWELGSWMLENFATVAEARAGLGSVVVPPVVLKQMGFPPDAHYVVRDATGVSMVVEIVGGEMHIHDAPLHVVTNSPTYDWHMTNLRNYVNLAVTNVPPLKIGSVTLQPMGDGTGLLGIPGDFTPPSRFVRAVAYSHSVPQQATGRDSVIQAFHILNNFDIPKGSVRADEKDQYGNVLTDHTLWTGAADMTSRTYYVRTFQDSQIRSVSLMDMAIDGPDVVTIPLDSTETIRPLVP
jgi:choloylglycine hydrolase